MRRESGVHPCEGGRLRGKAYVLTGPETLSDVQVLAILGEALGRKYSYVNVPEEAARKAMADMQMPGWMVDGFMELNMLIRTHALATVVDGVERVLGRPPRSFKEYARDYAAENR